LQRGAGGIFGESIQGARVTFFINLKYYEEGYSPEITLSLASPSRGRVKAGGRKMGGDERA